MSLPRVALLSLSLASPLARAEGDDCTLDAGQIKPQLAARLPRGFKLLSSKVDKAKRRAVQALRLPDGTEVTVTAGGCAHAAFSFAIRGKTIHTKTVAAELVAITRRVLPQLPMGKDVLATPALLLEGVDKAQITVLPAPLPCGDAHCTLALEPVEGAKAPKKEAGDQPAQLVLSYDFPL